MPKRKLNELEEEGDLTPIAKKSCDTTTTSTTASPASPTECASTSCIPGTAVDQSLPGCSSDTSGPSTSTQDEFTQIRKKRKTVKFNGVTVYYFPRKQGFICVPSQGGSTLGMSEKHMQTEKYSVSEYAKAQRRLHKQILREQQKAAGIAGKRNTRQKSDDSSSIASDSSSDSEDDLNVDEYYFLQPVPTRQRRILLRQSGIKKIDTIEKEECRDIRTSREMCGCDCRVYCDPETCSCSVAGIKCQVDRLSFPCGCSKDGCSNPVGRIEFNPIRVRTHFIHTVMRLEMDRKREQITQMCAPRTSACDYPQSGCDGDVTTQEEAETEDACHGVGDTQEDMDACNTEGNSSNGKNVDLSQTCTDKDNETETTESSETNSSQSVTSNNSLKPRKSCLKRIHSESKNGQDVTQFNSNDRGSCRDCGNTDVTEMLMAGAHFVDSTTTLEMEPITPSQTKVVDCTNSTPPEVGSADNVDTSSPQHSGDNTQPQQHFQQVMLFGDGEEEEYSAESGNMYGFKPEDSSYSESSDPDCCSEGSEEGTQQQSVSNGQFNACSSSAEGTNVTAPHYCIPGSSYEASTAQPEQKYMDLNSSTSGYKLEPISEILNPLRFASYDSNSLTHQSWHTANTTAYQYNDSAASTLPRYPARYPSMQQRHDNDAQSAGSAIRNQGYYNSTEQSTTNMLPYQPPPHQTSSNNANYHDNGAIPCISVSHNLADKSCDLPFTHTETSVVKDTDEDSGFKDLSASSSTASSPVKDDDDVTPKYHDLTSTSSVTTSSQFTDLSVTSVKNGVPDPAVTVTSDDDSNCRYTTLLSPTRHGSSDSSGQSTDIAENSKCKVQEGTTASLYQELDEEYILPKRTSVVAVPTDTINSSPTSQNEIKGNEIKDFCETSADTPVSKDQEHDGKKGKGVNEMSFNRESQNFGEIIKESIVETVSA